LKSVVFPKSKYRVVRYKKIIVSTYGDHKEALALKELKEQENPGEIYKIERKEFLDKGG